jgi:hypothetical protein
MKVTITINTDNDAFDSNFGGETASILREAAKIISERSFSANGYKLQDSNGNNAGTITIK